MFFLNEKQDKIYSIANCNFTKLTLDIPRYFLWDLCPA